MLRFKIFFLLLFSAFIGDVYSQTDNSAGIHFDNSLSWAAIQARAKTENKFILVVFSTPFCAGCQIMERTVFPQQECGNYFNAKFICVEMQYAGDTTAQGWAGDVYHIKKEYHIGAFPTFLIFTPDGHAIHRIIGGSTTPKDFIARVQNSFDPEKQYYTQLRKFQDGKNDSAFLRKLAGMGWDAYDLDNARQVAKAYFATQKDLFTAGALALLNHFTTSTKDEGFDVFYLHAAEVDKVLGPGVAEKKVRDILLREFVYPKIYAKDTAAPDWNAMQINLAAKYPAPAGEVIAFGKVSYYKRKNDWNNFQPVIVDYMKRFGSMVEAKDLNDYAWTVFQHCPDMTCLSDALDWSKRSFKDNNDPGFIDTYANILYKMGKKDDAISWEEKALALSAGKDKKGFQDTLDKMKRGENTWD